MPKEHKSYSIYALIDPRTDEVRYVGLTHDLITRYGQHLGYDDKSKKTAWIRELKQQKIMPILRELEADISTFEEARDREDYWINHYRDSPLTNHHWPALYPDQSPYAVTRRAHPWRAYPSQATQDATLPLNHEKTAEKAEYIARRIALSEGCYLAMKTQRPFIRGAVYCVRLVGEKHFIYLMMLSEMLSLSEKELRIQIQEVLTGNLNKSVAALEFFTPGQIVHSRA